MNRDDFRALVRAYSPELLRTAGRLTTSAEDAEEVVQDAWIAVWSAPERMPRDGSKRSWLHGVVRNLAKSRLRKQANRARLDSSTPHPNHGITKQLPVEASLLVDEVWAYIHELPEMQRRVVTARILDGLSVKETAAAINRAPGTVKATLCQALAKLRDKFGDSVFDALSNVGALEDRSNA